MSNIGGESVASIQSNTAAIKPNTDSTVEMTVILTVVTVISVIPVFVIQLRVGNDREF